MSISKLSLCTAGTLCLWVGLSGTGVADIIPLADPTYIPHDDYVTWNWQILEQEGVATNPGTPSGTTNYIRLYSNPASGGGPTNLDSYVIGWPNGDVTGGSIHWYGMNFASSGGNKRDGALTTVLQTSELLTAIQALTPGAKTPVFAFDQSQSGGAFSGPVPPADAGNWLGPTIPEPQALTDRDIWLRCRLILIPNAEVASLGLIGKTASQVDTALAGLLPDPHNVNGVPGITATANGDIVVYYLRENLFNDFPDPSLPPNRFNWAWAPGIFQPSLFGLPVDPSLVADNNIGGSVSDWGGYVPTLDLTQYPDYAVFVSFESKFNNDGGEELYIVGGIVPEPTTISIFTLGSLLLLRRRRR